MHRWNIPSLATAFIMLALMISACNKTAEQAGATPTDVWKTFYAAAQKGDGAALKRLLWKNTLDRLSNEAQSKNQTLEDYIAIMVGRRIVDHYTSETRNEKVEAKRATLEVKRTKGDQWETIVFIKEDDGWKVVN